MKWRTFMVDGMEWRFVIGRKFIAVRNANNVKHLITLSEITGMSESEMNREQCAYVFDVTDFVFQITPSMIADWIRSQRW